MLAGVVLVASVGAVLLWFVRPESPHDGNSDLAGSGRQRQEIRIDAPLDTGLDLSVYEQLVREPSRDGWESESSSDAVTAQLKAIGKVISHQQWDADFGNVVASNFECESLRPGPLQDVFHGAALLVRRCPKEQQRQSSANYHGAGGLVEALRVLREPFEPNADLQPEFKVYRIHTDGPSLLTRANVQIVGRTEAGILQQTATWRCRWSKSSATGPPRLAHIEVTSYEETVSQIGGSLFSDCTESVLGNNSSFREQLLPGLDYWGSRIPLKLGMLDPTGKHGISVADVNGDGLEDLYVIQPAGLPNGLYFQNHDGTATDVSAESNVDILDWSVSALFVDLDNDGDQDLIVSTQAGLLFWENDGTGKFTARAAKPTPMGGAHSLAAADYDNDRDLDIYVCCYAPHVPDEPQLLGKPVPYHDANNGAISILLQNEGGWRFRNVTKQVGLDVNNRRFSYAAAWEDYDNDGDQDLYVANDFGRNNLYRNDPASRPLATGGTRRFVDVAAQAGVEDISAGMSVSWGDYNHDGSMDLYVGNMFSSAGNRITYQRNFNKRAAGKTRTEFQRHARGNSLFKNLGNGSFEDVSVAAGVTMGRWAWSSNFVDLNNDGWEDVVVANGFLTNEDPRDL